MRTIKLKGPNVKHAVGRTFAVVNNSLGGGVINHVARAERETDIMSTEKREELRLKEAKWKKTVWQSTEYPDNDIEVVEVKAARR